jgi:hypothetical protein
MSMISRSFVGRCATSLMLLLPLLASGVASCSPDHLVGNQPYPPEIPDPSQTHTPAGALAAYRGAVLQLRTALGGDVRSFIPITGALTDELMAFDRGRPGVESDAMFVDSRTLPEDPGIAEDTTTSGSIMTVYGALQRTRGQANEARGALRAYAPDSSPALAGHLDAVEGYADVMLADLFCSGIPLSTLDFNGDFTYAPGSSTEEVYQRALALFDSALAISGDSTDIVNLARVGKGRTLLALGRYAEAGSAVADVPDGFRYALTFTAVASPGTTNGFTNRSFAYADFGTSGFGVTMADTEGVHGLPFVSGGDPRSAWVSGTSSGRPYKRPAKYPADGSGAVVLADGIEARLIEAEAQLHADDASWLATLNALRTDGTFDTQPDPVDTTQTDTLWHAGSGGVAGLAPLSDPGTPEARVDLVFRERAYWLFLTGHRQGDLRRLVREYGRDSESVYPTGSYPGVFGAYGGDVTAPVPGDERVINPLYTGCRSRGA